MERRNQTWIYVERALVAAEAEEVEQEGKDVVAAAAAGQAGGQHCPELVETSERAARGAHTSDIRLRGLKERRAGTALEASS